MAAAAVERCKSPVVIPDPDYFLIFLVELELNSEPRWQQQQQPVGQLSGIQGGLRLFRSFARLAGVPQIPNSHSRGQSTRTTDREVYDTVASNLQRTETGRTIRKAVGSCFSGRLKNHHCTAEFLISPRLRIKISLVVHIVNP